MSLQSYCLDPMLRLGKWLSSDGDAVAAYRLNRATLRLLELRWVPSDIAVRKTVIAGVPCEWIIPQHRRNGIVLLIHGGGFVAGTAASHREIAWRLGRCSDCRVLSIDYKLAPEYTYPTQLEEVCAVYRSLLSRGFAPERIGLAGDSAGGNLALAAALACKAERVPLPGAIVCFSPWVDLTHTHASIERNAKRDPVIATVQLGPTAALYRGGRDAADPMISPLFADLRGLPPLQLHAMAGETLLDDTLQLAERATGAGVEVDCRLWSEAPHAAPLFADVLPEGRAILQRSGQFLKRKLSH